MHIVDHDQVFKTLIKAFFREFLELFLPEKAAAIDFQTVRFLEQEQFTDTIRGRKKRMDLVAEVRLKDGVGDLILVHSEFQARRGADFPHRMYQYCCQLFLRHDKPVLPIALFTDDALWRERVPDTYQLRVGGDAYVTFRYHLIKLKDLDAKAYLTGSNPLAIALAAKMRYSNKEMVRLKADFLRLITGAGLNPARQSLLEDFVETYTPMRPDQQAEFRDLIQSNKTYAKVAKMITVYEKDGIKKGLQQGLQKGRQAGLLEAKRETLLMLMRKKFRFVDSVREQQVHALDSVKRLDALLLAVIDAETIDDLGL